MRFAVPRGNPDQGAAPRSDEERTVSMTTPDVPDAANGEALPSRVRLPFAFDAGALAVEALAFDEGAWRKHFNRAYYEGDWSYVSLRTPFGWLPAAPDPTGTAPWGDTPNLERCPAVRGVLAEIGCDTRSVRLLRLGPAARILEHEDHNIGVDYGFVRLHIPVITGPGVEFVLAGEPLHMGPGECWYLDVLNAHSVMNPGPGPRIHLVVDCVVNPALMRMLTAPLSC
jgi:aspartyl/asparaginyl beta-hydroxylase